MVEIIIKLISDESRDFVSVSRPIFASLGLEGVRSRLEGYRSRDFAYCKEMV